MHIHGVSENVFLVHDVLGKFDTRGLQFAHFTLILRSATVSFQQYSTAIFIKQLIL